MSNIVLKKKNGHYKIPRFIRFRISKKNNFTYEKSNNSDIEERQISLLVNALNITNKKERLSYIYDETCRLLDNDFYGKNICEFKNGKCMHDRCYNSVGGGCCCNKDKSLVCPYLSDKGCTVKCLACKFHTCKMVRDKGYRFKVNDIYMLKYLLNWKQKIMLYLDFFMSKEEVLKDLNRNSIILWNFSKTRKFIKKK